MAHEDLPTCGTIQDVRSSTGKRAVVVGTYSQIDVRMRRKGPAQYIGHAAVRLVDGTEMLLEPTWSAAARRSEAERARFEGKKVEVVGTVHLESPQPPEPAAFIQAPCVSPVEQIALSETAS